MKNRLFIYLLIGLLIAASSLFGYYLWFESSQTQLNTSDLNLLGEVGEIAFIGDYSFPPLSFTNTEGQFTGYEADLVTALELYFGIPVTYTQMPWEEALETLSSGKATAITGMRITDARTGDYSFTNPYWQTSYSFIYPVGSDLDTLFENDNLIVAVQERSATYDYFVNYYYREGIDFIAVREPAEAIALLTDNRADLWFENYQVARYESLKTGLLEFFIFDTVPESVGQYAIALGPDYEELVSIFNKALLHLEQEKVLTDLDRKWFGLADYRPERTPLDQALPIIVYLLFALFIIIGFWNRYLQLKVNEKTEELSKSEKKYKASYESSHDAIIITSTKGVILDCNKNALVLFGFHSQEDFMAYQLQTLFPEKQPDGSLSETFYPEKIKLVVEEGTPLRFEWAYRRKSGILFQGEVALTTFSLGGEIMIQNNIRDITDRRQIQEKLEYLSLHDQLTGLHNRAFFEAELIRFSDKQYYPFTLISCDIDSLKLINDAFGHQAGDQQLVECAEILKESLRNTDVLARIGGDEFCVVMPNTDRESGARILERIGSNITRYNESNPAVPMGVSLGIATTDNLESSAGDLIKQADELMYRNKAFRSATAINSVLNYLLAKLDRKDNYAEGHCKRMEKHCLEMGRAINLSPKQKTDLQLLVKLHDLGKVSIPDQILNKSGPLNQYEWEMVKQHSEKGYRIARSSPELAGAADLILKHHECWNGSGYPLGLAGEEIPIECRIFAMVETYDAMTNRRPYAEAKSKAEALNEIKQTAGEIHDPSLVNIFISIIDKN